MAVDRAVLLVGFGGPESLDEVPGFVESVLHRAPPEHVVTSALERYRAIGGRSPLPETTRRQAELLSAELARRGEPAPVYVGMLHARPTIEETAAAIVSDRVDSITVVSLAPYRCEVSTDAYEEAARKALEGSGVTLHLTDDWNLEPGYVAALGEMLAGALTRAPSDTPVVFTAHSLPVRMIEQGDPYVDQLTATAAAVAEKTGVEDWRLAYQSVSAAAREPWLIPSVEQVMDELAAQGSKAVVVDPIGFVSDHVETLYDNDAEHRAHARRLGLDFHRCRCLNDDPGFIAALADIVVATGR